MLPQRVWPYSNFEMRFGKNMFGTKNFFVHSVYTKLFVLHYVTVQLLTTCHGCTYYAWPSYTAVQFNRRLLFYAARQLR